MYARFEQAEEEKRQAIINAALAEFSENGYSRASTNEIVKRAGISKGLLFHYFGTKRQLFLYLFNWGMDYLIGRFEKELDLGERDVMTRLWSAVELKMRISRSYPTLFSFFQQVFSDTPPDILNEIMKTRDLLSLDIYSRLFENIDTSRFREGLDIARSLSAIRWVLEGYGNTIVEKLRRGEGHLDVTATFAESAEYFAFVRKLFYREQYWE